MADVKVADVIALIEQTFAGATCQADCDARIGDVVAAMERMGWPVGRRGSVECRDGRVHLHGWLFVNSTGDTFGINEGIGFATKTRREPLDGAFVRSRHVLGSRA